MSDKRQLIPIAGLLTTMGIAVYMVIQLNGQAAAVVTGDFRHATTAEVRDAQGQVVLQGSFAAGDDEGDDDVERKALLKSTGIHTGATGEAEVELSTTTPVEQEVELSAQSLPAGATYTFVIDGTTIGSATADERGRVELELEVKMPGLE